MTLMPDNSLIIPTLPEIDLVGRDAPYAVSSDDDDILVRRERARQSQFDEKITIQIDGYTIENVPLAVPKTTSQGAELRDELDRPIPRRTTVYDAARKLVVDGVWTEEELKERLPVLCHMSHLNPVAVCRVCSVFVVREKRNELVPERKLFPACHLEVSKGMSITTRLGAERHNPVVRDALTPDNLKNLNANADKVKRSVGLVVEMLYADHKPEPITWEEGGQTHTEDKRYENELQKVAERFKLEVVRPRLRRPDGAFDRNRMLEAEPSDSNPLLPHTKPLRRIPLDLLEPTAPDPKKESLGDDVDAAWQTWNRVVDERFPYSSRTVVVDHNKCILCDRCVRSCSDVKPFKVIGHTGKGYATRISFDLDYLMGPRDRHDGEADPNLEKSTCVQCGECMTACPTGALSLRRRVQPRAWGDESPKYIPENPNTPLPTDSEFLFLTAEQIRDIVAYYVPPTRPGVPARTGRVVRPFADVPFAYLKWNEGAVRKRVIPAGETQVLAWGGEYGTTAFLLSGTGKFNVFEPDKRKTSPGWVGRLLGKQSEEVVRHEKGPKINKDLIPGTTLLLGEMAPLTQKPRTATIEVFADPDELGLRFDWNAQRREFVATPDPRASRDVVVYEMTRNMLDMFLRSQSTRQAVKDVYEPRAIERGISQSLVISKIPDKNRQREVTNYLIGTGQLKYFKKERGEMILAEGDRARDFYLIRIGSVEIFKTIGGRKQVISRLGDGEPIGELALLADELRARKLLPPKSTNRTRRQATVAALDPVEVIRIPQEVFDQLCKKFPDVLEILVDIAKSRLAPTLNQKQMAALTGDYMAQGLFQGQKLLVLDLLSCTRCDECTRACADSHDGNARLLRDGLRFGDFLVATSCRSCHTPYCMDGCPVDAIHRKGTHLEVRIEDHCIGCGLCEKNCPYGSIHMISKTTTRTGTVAIARRAVNCDLCADVGGKPYCVSACPHDAAFRMDGNTLMETVLSRLPESNRG
jgi:Fe-S-cluster-containing hydrogenase component 2